MYKLNTIERLAQQANFRSQVRINSAAISALASANQMAAGNTMWGYDDFIAEAIRSLVPFNYGVTDYEAIAIVRGVQ